MWWGLFLIAAGSWAELPTVIAPLLMTVRDTMVPYGVVQVSFFRTERGACARTCSSTRPRTEGWS